MNKPTKKQKIEMLEIANAFLKAEIAELEKERDVRDLEQQAKGVKEALAKVKWMGGGFLHECFFEDRIHDLQTQAKELKEQGEWLK